MPRKRKYIVRVSETTHTFFIVEAENRNHVAVWAEEEGEDAVPYIDTHGEQRTRACTAEVVGRAVAVAAVGTRVVNAMKADLPDVALDEKGEET